MSAIDEIVLSTYKEAIAESLSREDTCNRLAKRLEEYSRMQSHELGWVLKKAHATISQLAWQAHNAPINRALGFPDDYTG
jgi:hypothetical protein